MSKIKLSTVVITYYPDLLDLIRNIKQYINYIDKLIIWENTPIQDRDLYKLILPEYSDKIIYLGTDINEGMSYALNRSVEWSLNNGFTHILTMDQDGYWINFDHYLRNVTEYCSNSSIGIFGPNISLNMTILPEYEIVKDTITSGSIYRLDMFRNTGLFREDFFIDAVDLEFCYNAARKGFNTVVLGDCYLKQKFGNASSHIFLNKIIQTTNYNSFRLFQIVKNHIFLWREYPEIPEYQKKLILTEYTFHRIIKILLFENGKVGKIFSIFKGATYGLFHIGERPRQKC
jgi:rhamnosyltransferase